MKNQTDFISDIYRIQKSDKIIVQQIREEIIILNTKNENYLGLDQMGTSFWNALFNSDSVKSAYENLLEEYDVDPKVLYLDMNNFIQGLLDAKLIRLSKI